MKHNTQSGDENNKPLNKKSLWRFILPSLFGGIIFLLPIYDGTTFNIPLGIITEFFIELLENYLPFIVTYTMVISTLLTFISLIFKPAFIMKSDSLKSIFHVSIFWTITRTVGTVFALMTFHQFGWSLVNSEITGGVMFGLLTTLIVWFFVASFLMPYLINFGIMEFTGTLLRTVIRPLFTLPGRSAIDLLSSWIGNVNVGVVLTR